MSMHKIPLNRTEEEGLRAHGLDIGTPSQLSDAFRLGVAWGQKELLAAIDDVIDGTVIDENRNRDDDGMMWDWNCKPQKIEKWMARLADARKKAKEARS
jgi:hypothetical protein